MERTQVACAYLQKGGQVHTYAAQDFYDSPSTWETQPNSNNRLWIAPDSFTVVEGPICAEGPSSNPAVGSTLEGIKILDTWWKLRNSSGFEAWIPEGLVRGGYPDSWTIEYAVSPGSQ